MTMANIVTGTDSAEQLRGTTGNDVIFGLGGADGINGLDGDDTIDGGLGNDVINGNLGSDTLDYSTGFDANGGIKVDFSVFGATGWSPVRIDRNGDGRIEESDFVRVFVAGLGDVAETGVENVIGTIGNDVILGNDADNTFFGSFGDDVLVGRSGIDTADYSDLGVAVTLQTAGLVLKDGGAAGTDVLGTFDPNDLAGFETFERVIGAVGQRNVIDATSRTGAVNVTVDLGAETFSSTVVVESPAFPAFTLGTTFGFEVVNFVDVLGTENDDKITGSDADNFISGAGGDDEFFGSGGDDEFVGGDGTDSVDYSDLGAAVTLQARGVIEKEGVGSDTIEGIERIVGDADFAADNWIDGFNPDGNNVAFNVDLRDDQLTVLGVPGLGDVVFGVENFRNARGTNSNDTLRGDEQDNILAGGAGIDNLQGRAGDDTLKGGSGNDTLDGGTGFDTVDYSDVTSATGGIRVNLATFGVSGFSAVTVDRDGNGTFEETDQVRVQRPVDAAKTGTENVIGSAGNDSIAGNSGDNVLFGGPGSDTLSGGGANDTFVFRFEDGVVDFVTDLTATDSILLDTSFGALVGQTFTGTALAGLIGVGLDIGGDILSVAEAMDVFSLSFNGDLFAELTTNGFA